MKKSFSIVKNEGSNDIVFDYHPKTFPLIVTPQASAFLNAQENKKSDFKISELVSNQTGIAQLERKGAEDKVEELVLKKVQEIQEKAYREAYQLGLIDGTERAYGDKKQEIEERIQRFDKLFFLLDDLRNQFFAENEKQLMELLVQVAGKIAFNQIKEDPESILHVLETVMLDLQKDEKITVYLSSQDAAMVEDFRQRGGKKAEELKRLKLEVGETIKSGGCLFETNYGIIDATLEQRVSRVLASLLEHSPKFNKKNIKEE